MIKFDVKKKTAQLIKWIKDYILWSSGENGKIVINVDGSLNSTVALALCTRAIGAENVVAVTIDGVYEFNQYIMPALVVCNIPKDNIWNFDYISMDNTLEEWLPPFANKNTTIRENLFNRAVVLYLYTIADTIGENIAKVVNTCNLSDNWIGDSVRHGNNICDFAPLSDFTRSEVEEIGMFLGLPDLLIYGYGDNIEKTSCEKRFGITYEALDLYIRSKVCDDEKIKAKIDELHYANIHKLKPMPKFNYRPDRIEKIIERRMMNESTSNSGHEDSGENP